MAGVGHSYAVMLGRRMGDRQKATEYLSGLIKTKREEMNRQESRNSPKPRKGSYKLGERVRRMVKS